MASLKLKEYCTDNSCETLMFMKVLFWVYTEMTGSFMHEAILSSFGKVLKWVEEEFVKGEAKRFGIQGKIKFPI